MGKYRNSPVEIEAFRMGIDPRPDWFQDKVNANEIVTMLDDDAVDKDGNPFEFHRTRCHIVTLKGVMKGDYGDYIIKDVRGEVYPCKPDIFEKTYESADSNEWTKENLERLGWTAK